jgi:Rrf2 family protein
MIFSQRHRLALAVVIDIATHSKEGPIKAHQIAARQGLPRRYFEPLLRRLAGEGILAGTRGRSGGGYRLGRDTASISVWDILVAASDHKQSGRLPSQTSLAIEQLEKQMIGHLQRVTLRQLVRSAAKE